MPSVRLLINDIDFVYHFWFDFPKCGTYLLLCYIFTHFFFTSPRSCLVLLRVEKKKIFLIGPIAQADLSLFNGFLPFKSLLQHHFLASYSTIYQIPQHTV
jgi:hypothetical protein